MIKFKFLLVNIEISEPKEIDAVQYKCISIMLAKKHTVLDCLNVQTVKFCRNKHTLTNP